jgi:hypothetical protein
MMRRICARLRYSVFLLVTAAASAAAQGAVTVTGHVSASSMPVRGATVRIAELNLGSTSDADGRFSFIIPASRVLGQTVALVASHPRFPSKSISVVLVGDAIDRDFDLTPPSGPARLEPARPSETTTAPTTSPAGTSTAVRSIASSTAVPLGLISAPMIDSSALTDLAGPITLGAALAGRFAAVDVRSASTLGGTTALLVRGPHTIAGLTEPLIVVNGIVFENSNITTLTQQSGQGGFDYGTTLNDINVEDIATVQLLTGSLAAMQFGGRAANGVLVITTRSARGLHALEVSASQSYSNGSVLRLPDYQNAYGQGLGGKFAFFDGKGGGINDTTSQSWGPALDGSIVLQASLRESARADARAWLPSSGNIASYFNGGRTLGTNVVLQRGSDRGQFRASLSNRSSTGVTPESRVAYRSALFTGSVRPTDKLSVQADLQAYSDRGQHRAGTGFDESNPVAGFAILPRQVAVPFYRVLLRDATGAQLSWNYSGRNNPFWASLVNDNTDSRTRYVLGGSGSYALTNQLTASIRGASDAGSQDRRFDVAAGWMGGFPYYLGRGNFSKGGYQSDAINTSLRDVEASLRFAPQSAGVFQAAYTIGVGHHGDRLETTTRATDNLTDSTTVKDVLWNASSSTNVLFARIESRIDDRASIAIAARSESSTLMSGTAVSNIYPSVTASVDLVRPEPSSHAGGLLDRFTLQAGFSRSGSEGTALLLQRLGVTTATSAAVVADAAAPEVTTGVDGGAAMRVLGGRLGIDLSVYSDRSENLIVPSGVGFTRTASVTNKGVEATASLAPFQGPGGMMWSIAGTFGKNSNMVEAIAGAGTSSALGLPFGTATIEAREGSPLGVIVGTSFLRSADGMLILRKGVPLADTVAGRHVVGESAPSWIGGLATSVRVGALELGVQFDTRRGGQLFSASNRAGAYSGGLAETAFRPDSGLLINGVDATTGIANTIHASTEDYYHALGAITERWVYDASFVKLREARATFTLPLQFINLLRVQSLRASVIGRNLALWTSAPNIDPETVLSASTFRGAEMGQLPTVKSLGFQFSLTP